MTKDEAVQYIMDAARLMQLDSIVVRKIINQIDQPPGEFTVRELVSLLGTGHYVHLYANGCWFLASRRNHNGQGIDALRDKLIELAKPPEPTTVTAEIPLTTARYYAQFRHGDVAKACKAALEKAKL